MPDAAQVNRSLSTIRTELEFLRDAGVISPPQMQSIHAQLPQPGGAPSQYVDPHYGQQNMPTPMEIAKQSQDPGHPAHPNNPGHASWAKSLASKFGNAAMFGAGATFGGDMVNDALHAL